MEITTECYLEAVDRLIEMAWQDCGGGEVTADFLIAWHCATPWKMGDMWRLDGAHRGAIITVLTYIAYSPFPVYPPVPAEIVNLIKAREA